MTLLVTYVILLNRKDSLCQRKYALDMIQEAGLLGAKPCSTPMEPNLQFNKTFGTPIADPSSYRRLIGKLLYLTHSRPEISFAVSKLSQFLESPTDIHLQAATRVLRFIKNAPGQGLFFSSNQLSLSKGSVTQIGVLVQTLEGQQRVFASS